MKLAFWKSKRSRRRSAGAADADVEPGFESAAGDADASEAAALQLRVRTRRRLVGACALLLAVVVLVPMLLDPTPRAVPDNIPIDLPSDRTPFAAKVTPPAAPETAAPAGAAPLPAAPGSAADAAAEVPAAAPPPAAPAGESKAGAKPDTGQARKHAGDSAGADARHAVHKAEAAASVPARIYVQAAALASETAAQELASRIGKSGLASFVERADTGEGVRYRVRLGPFASRAEAERSRARLHALGVSANIVGAG